MRLHIHSSGSTVTGRRGRNEDALLLAPEHGVFAVLDGMGGYDGGDLASTLAVEAITRFFATTAQDPDATWPYAIDVRRTLAYNRVEAAIRLANRRIREQRHDRLSGMGSTVALLCVVGSHAIVGHLGDSRVYRLRAGELVQLTCDHSLYEQLRASGLELPPLAEYPFANVITRALGPDDDERPELAELDLLLGDRYLLCTDGLSGVLEPERLAELLGAGDCAHACACLIDAAYEAGSRDNITAVVVDVGR